MKNSLVAIWYGRFLTIRRSWYQVRAERENDWSTAGETIGMDFVKHETQHSAHAQTTRHPGKEEAANQSLTESDK